MMTARPILLALLAPVACAQPSADAQRPPAPPPPPPVVSAPPPPAPAPAAASAPPPEPVTSAPAPVATRYPVGKACSDPAAIAKEKRTLPPAAEWTPERASKAKVSVKVPRGVFKPAELPDGIRLVSNVSARGLGPDGDRPRPFAIRIRRVARAVDDLLSDRKSTLFGGVYLEGPFPKRTTASFVAHEGEPVGSGDAARMTVAGKPAWVVVAGGHGYNTDWVLVAVAPDETLVVDADWNSAIMAGQPECWQRAVIGGVVESITLAP